MKLTLTLALSTLILSTAALPYPLASLDTRDDMSSPDSVEPNDSHHLGLDDNSWGPNMRRVADAVLGKRHGGPWDHWGNNNNWGNNNQQQNKDNKNNWGNNNGQQQNKDNNWGKDQNKDNNWGKDQNKDNNWGKDNKNNQQNNNNGGHDANWNGVYEQTPNCTPADGVATDGNSFWADNCDLGAGENGWGQ